MMSRIAVSAAAVVLGLGIAGWTCATSGDEDEPGPDAAVLSTPSPVPPVVIQPFDFDQVTEPVPLGFSSWQEYVSFVQELRFGRVPGGVIEPLEVTINPDGTLTIVPAVITLPDGSTGRWVGTVPNGAWISFNEDGTVSLDPVDSISDPQP